jgi:hypothetical protein
LLLFKQRIEEDDGFGVKVLHARFPIAAHMPLDERGSWRFRPICPGTTREPQRRCHKNDRVVYG